MNSELKSESDPTNLDDPSLQSNRNESSDEESIFPRRKSSTAPVTPKK